MRRLSAQELASRFAPKRIEANETWEEGNGDIVTEWRLTDTRLRLFVEIEQVTNKAKGYTDFVWTTPPYDYDDEVAMEAVDILEERRGEFIELIKKELL